MCYDNDLGQQKGQRYCHTRFKKKKNRKNMEVKKKEKGFFLNGIFCILAIYYFTIKR